MSYRIDPKQKITYYNWRYRFILILVALIFIALIARMIDLMMIKRNFLQGQGDARALRMVEIPAYRGMLLDRNGQPLAVSSPVEAVWINPVGFGPSSKQLKQLAHLLQIPSGTIEQRVNKNKQREFLYLARGIDPEIAAQIQALHIPGLYLRQEYKRYYPDGEVSAQLLGFTNIDDEGQEGAELAYNSILGGQPGLRQVVKDRLGNIVENINVMREPRAGQDVTLSIDRRIQYLAYKNLKEAVAKYAATSGSVIVLDVKTGEVLAMANVPSYNPNDRPADTNGSYRNRAVTDVFEPGSTIKPFGVYLGLASGKYAPTTLINTNPGWKIVSGHRVQDETNRGEITVAEVLQYSSNMGVSSIVLSLAPNALWELLNQLGFGSSTYSGFPGESAGYLPARRYWDPFILATLSFGYGMTTTTLQLTHAYATIAGDGIERPISLLKLNAPPEGKQILDPKVTRQLITIMETVVDEGGTALRAQVPGYLVAGKTGTTRMVGPQGYLPNHHDAKFAGLAPATDPRYVVVVHIVDPHRLGYEGGQVAAPVFANVMAGVLQIMNVPADHV